MRSKVLRVSESLYNKLQLQAQELGISLREAAERLLQKAPKEPGQATASESTFSRSTPEDWNRWFTEAIPARETPLDEVLWGQEADPRILAQGKAPWKIQTPQSEAGQTRAERSDVVAPKETSQERTRVSWVKPAFITVSMLAGAYILLSWLFGSPNKAEAAVQAKEVSTPPPPKPKKPPAAAMSGGWRQAPLSPKPIVSQDEEIAAQLARGY